MIKRYIINFWVWWYVVKAYDLAQELIGYWGFLLNYLNIPSMLTNLFVPLYQDYSWGGKFISLIIRSAWVIFGSLVMIFVTIPIIFIYFVYILIPFMPVFALIGTYIKWF